jgi:hypothetical protein
VGGRKQVWLAEHIAQQASAASESMITGTGERLPALPHRDPVAPQQVRRTSRRQRRAPDALAGLAAQLRPGSLGVDQPCHGGVGLQIPRLFHFSVLASYTSMSDWRRRCTASCHRATCPG